MGKILMGQQILIYPIPVVLVGVTINDKPNFMAAAWCGVANSEPPMISFSINVPSSELVRETDYCGIVSGSKVNKVEVCHFKVFFGKLRNTPLIEQCPINLECKVMHILDLGSHSLVVGRIEETYFSETCLTDGKPDVNKVKPFTYNRPNQQYLALGEVIAKAYSVGKELIA